MSNLKTVSFDPAVYRLVPVEADDNMIHDAAESGNLFRVDAMNAVEAAILGVPDTLPGVVEHSGEPIEALLLSDCVEGSHPKYGGGLFSTNNCITDLFTHPPAQPEQFSDADSLFRAMQVDDASIEALKARIAELEKSDAMWDDEIRMRDNYHDWADKLAESISAYFGVDIGEHSSANNPWAEALDTIENAPERIAAQAGQEPVAAQARSPEGGEWGSLSLDEYDYATDNGYETRKLYAASPAPANAIAIVQASLDAAASHIEDHTPFAAQSIRTITPQSVIDSMEWK